MNQLNKILMCFLLSLLGCILCSCSFDDKTITESTAGDTNVREMIDESKEITEEVVWYFPNGEIGYFPTREEVYEAHDKAFAGMKDADIDAFMNFIFEQDQYWENRYFYGNTFKDLGDPDSPEWIGIDRVGSYQVGWAFDTDMVYDPDKTDLTEDEYNELYGTSVMGYSEMDAITFIEKVEGLKEMVQSQTLVDNLNDLIENMRQARETHDVQYIWNVFYILHDLDYYLCRYGVEDFASVGANTSFVSGYYGTLHEYQ